MADCFKTPSTSRKTETPQRSTRAATGTKTAFLEAMTGARYAIKKQGLSLLLVCGLIGTSGCMTIMTAGAARENTHQNDKGETVVDRPQRPAYYLLLPLAFVGDAATLPFQAILFLMLSNYHDC
jgi:uncharacterized protein YceK